MKLERLRKKKKKHTHPKEKTGHLKIHHPFVGTAKSAKSAFDVPRRPGKRPAEIYIVTTGTGWW